MTMIPKDLEEKLAKLREEYYGEENHKEIDMMEKRLTDKLVAADLKNVDGVKEILEDARGRIKDANLSLAYDEELTELDRARLTERRNIFEHFILRRFGAYKTSDAIGDLEKYVDEKLAL